jgi:hypothetical protein
MEVEKIVLKLRKSSHLAALAVLSKNHPSERGRKLWV